MDDFAARGHRLGNEVGHGLAALEIERRSLFHKHVIPQGLELEVIFGGDLELRVNFCLHFDEGLIHLIELAR